MGLLLIQNQQDKTTFHHLIIQPHYVPIALEDHSRAINEKISFFFTVNDKSVTAAPHAQTTKSSKPGEKSG